MCLTLEGVVTSGHGRGRILGFPTANLAISVDSDTPVDGIYACFVNIPPEPVMRPATMSVGYNPTFHDVVDRQYEVFIHDLDRNIYGDRVRVKIVERLRDIIAFPNVEALVEQSARDIEMSQEILALVTHLDPASDDC